LGALEQNHLTLGPLGDIADRMRDLISCAACLLRSIAGRIKKMMVAADGIADGDVNQQIDSTCKDELGATAAAFHRMIDYLKTMAGAAELIADGNLSVEVHPRSAHDALGNAFAAMIANLRDLVGKLSQAAGSVGTASQRSRSARPR
jgi:methyl-accepting chemotaxis protein